ncbi:spore coat protein [Sporomusa acidovorans]|uniref:spore coat protein n=1 Tax=Sporomusa acidovorans TaxID=112900 RepID=UPI000882E93B|nr:spore coat protein [Sporomusa acidovorans]OZC19105.1 hypothetical protein SPACI_31910 [Sporomusa acidovorans DSM 3132]SDD67419.1 Coat F domain-containing protein [Sporomusa acidovorans]
MNTVDYLTDVMQDEKMMQSMYNKNMMDITNPEVRQLFTQLRDAKMQNLSQLQQEIQTLMGQGQN